VYSVSQRSSGRTIPGIFLAQSRIATLHAVYHLETGGFAFRELDKHLRLQGIQLRQDEEAAFGQKVARYPGRGFIDALGALLLAPRGIDVQRRKGDDALVVHQLKVR
jgi:hypothetical protein